MSHGLSQGQRIKFTIAVSSLAFGAWCLAAPDMAVNLAVTEDFQVGRPLAALAVAAIGGQALAAGLVAAFARFRSWTFPGFALSFLPVLAADWWLFAKVGAFNSLIIVHAALLIVVMGLCARGYFAMRRDEIATGQIA